MSEKDRALQTLDGMRGVAAILVVARHVTFAPSAPESFLTVDFFFLLSGVVIAHAYDGRLSAGGFTGGFLLARLIRLYPLYFLGFGFACLALLTPGFGPADGLSTAIIAGLLMLPGTPLTGGVGCSVLNGPTWTLPLELLANGVYAVFYRVLTRFTLAALVATSSAILIRAAYENGSLDAGWAWEQLPLGLSRVGVSFFAGVLMRRIVPFAPKLSRVWPPVLLAAIAVTLVARPPAGWRASYELLLVLVVFPTLVFFSYRLQPVGRLKAVCHFLGVTSYAVYTLHEPLSWMVSFGATFIGHPLGRRDKPLFFIFIIALLALTWWLDGAFDAPVRRFLSGRLLRNNIRKTTRVHRQSD